MKVLTIIATIFMPLTFLAGVYGMNFKHFPEIEWYWGYFIWWGVVILLAGIMALFQKEKVALKGGCSHDRAGWQTGS